MNSLRPHTVQEREQFTPNNFQSSGASTIIYNQVAGLVLNTNHKNITYCLSGYFRPMKVVQMMTNFNGANFQKRGRLFMQRGGETPRPLNASMEVSRGREVTKVLVLLKFPLPHKCQILFSQIKYCLSFTCFFHIPRAR